MKDLPDWDLRDAYEEAMAELDHLRAENAELQELLREYGDHTEGCSGKFGDNYRCRCGWRQNKPDYAPARDPSDYQACGGLIG